MLRIYVKLYFNTCLPFLAFRLYSIEPGNFLNDIPSLPLEFYYINKICIPIIFLYILEVFLDKYGYPLFEKLRYFKFVWITHLSVS